MTVAAIDTTSNLTSGARLVDTTGRSLPLRASRLQVEAGQGFARTRLSQTFHNPHPEPLRVTYLLPLPESGAVAGFAFVVDGVRTEGVVKVREQARQDFERALLHGHTAALLEQQRSSVFQEEVGNLPPGAVLEVEVRCDQPLGFLEGAWEYRFPTVVGPRYMGAAGRVADAVTMNVPVADAPASLPRAQLELKCGDRRTGPIVSPSHALGGEGDHVRFAEEQGAQLDRDVVLRWPVAESEPGVSLGIGRPSELESDSFGVLTVTPPRGEGPALPRHLVLLVDVSGSMSGAPLAQARVVLSALVRTLGPDDQLEMVAFGSQAERWRRRPARMKPSRKAEALAWIERLAPSGATEMLEGIREALRGASDKGAHQILVVTDGYIGFEEEILRVVQTRLPPNGKVHALGVGSAPNQSLIAPLARLGGGLDFTLELDADAEKAAAELRRATDRPRLVRCRVEGSALLETAELVLPDVYAHRPALIPLRLRPEGGELRFSARGPEGRFEQTLKVSAAAPGTGLPYLGSCFARARVEALEAERHLGRSVDAEVERLGVAFQIATRRTSWVAVSQARAVDPAAPSRGEVMPHMLPHGMAMPAPASFGGAPRVSASLPQGGGGAFAEADAWEGMVHVAEAPDLDEPDWEVEAPEPSPLPMPKGAPAGARRPRLQRDEMFATFEAKEAKKAKQEEAERRVLRGELRVHDEGWLVVELELLEGLAWDPEDRWVVVFEDGRRAELELDTELSTQPGSYPAGVRLRLALRAPGEGRVLRLESLEGRMEIGLS